MSLASNAESLTDIPTYGQEHNH